MRLLSHALRSWPATILFALGTEAALLAPAYSLATSSGPDNPLPLWLWLIFQLPCSLLGYAMLWALPDEFPELELALATVTLLQTSLLILFLRRLALVQ